MPPAAPCQGDGRGLCACGVCCKERPCSALSLLPCHFCQWSPGLRMNARPVPGGPRRQAKGSVAGREGRRRRAACLLCKERPYKTTAGAFPLLTERRLRPYRGLEICPADSGSRAGQKAKDQGRPVRPAAATDSRRVSWARCRCIRRRTACLSSCRRAGAPSWRPGQS